MSKSFFTVMEVGGFYPSIYGMRLPHQSTHLMDSYVLENSFILGEADKKLAGNLICAGTEHAKFSRGIVAWFKIDMPRKIWSELDTYTVGMLPVSSESTMHRLLKDTISDADFDEETDTDVIEFFSNKRDSIIAADITINKKKNRLKSALPDGYMQQRVRGFSYQALRNMYFQRRNHALVQWQIICDEISKLPYANELILVNREGKGK